MSGLWAGADPVFGVLWGHFGEPPGGAAAADPAAAGEGGGAGGGNSAV